MTTPQLENDNEYERGPMHGEHTRKFYILGGVVLVIAGMIGGYLLGPEDWHIARSMLTGVLIALWSGFCVFAWHMLLGTVEER